MSELVSIIMPVYNTAKYLPAAVDSILKQTYGNIELLIGDDGSTDESWTVISSFSDPRIRKIRFENNRGNLTMCNHLFSECKGAYVGIQDADDWCDLDRIEKEVAFLQQHPATALVGTAFGIGDENGNVRSRHKYELDKAGIERFIDQHQYLPFHCASVLVRREVLDTVGNYRMYFDRISAADFDWVYRIMGKYELGMVTDTYYYYRTNPASFTRTFNKNLKRKFSEKLAFFFLEERRRTGTDSLAENDRAAITAFLAPLELPYQKNAGLIYADESIVHLKAANYLTALRYNIAGILKAPAKGYNYSAFFRSVKYILAKYLK